MTTCACGSEKAYLECCGRFIAGHQQPSTPEELMRSRYTAYTLADMDYIVRTMKSPASDEFDPESAKEWAEETQWIKLEILRSSIDGKKGMVEFLVEYTLHERTTLLYEISDFEQEDGVWYYVDGKTSEKHIPITSIKAGRNDACSCGSGKKYKKCCGK